MKLALRKTPAEGANLLARIACWAIKARLVSQFCHGGVVVGDTLYHATAHSGLCSTAYNPEHWNLYDLGTERDNEALQLFIKHAEAGYDWFSLLAFVLPFRVSDTRRFYCFEWCQLCMTGEYPIDRVTPEDLLLLIKGKS